MGAGWVWEGGWGPVKSHLSAVRTRLETPYTPLLPFLRRMSMAPFEKKKKKAKLGLMQETTGGNFFVFYFMRVEQ